MTTFSEAFNHFFFHSQGSNFVLREPNPIPLKQTLWLWRLCGRIPT